MLKRDWLGLLVAALVAAGCSTLQVAPSTEAQAALAPAGKLRVAFLAVSIYATRDAVTGQYRGVAVDLGEALARKLGVAFEAVPQSSLSELLTAVKAGSVDVVLTGITPERAAVMDFSAPYMEVEQGLLARAGAPVTRLEDIDRAGVRVGVLEKASADALLTRQLKNAEVVRAPNIDQLIGLIAAGKADLVAGTKARLLEEAVKLPGSRVLDGRILVEPVGMGVPKGRHAAAAQYVGQFVEDAKASGLVARAIANARLVGVVVAPPK